MQHKMSIRFSVNLMVTKGLERCLDGRAMTFSHNLVPFLSYSVDWIAELNPVQMNYPIKWWVVGTIVGLEGHRQTLVWPDLEHMSSFYPGNPFWGWLYSNFAETKNESFNHSSFVYNPAFIRKKNTSNIWKNRNEC